MSVITHGKLFEPLLGAATDLCWRQWAAIASGPASDTAPARTIIDPEALLLASTVLAGREPRLAELTEWFMVSLSQVLSVGRTRRLAKDLIPTVEARLHQLAHLAATRGGDARWQSLAEHGVKDPAPDLRWSLEGRSPMTPRYQRPAALVFRLRMGLGVGIKADALAFLLGKSEWCTVREIADATAWNTVAVGRALGDLALAGFIESSDPEPWQSNRIKQYRADHEAWQSVGRLDARAGWGYHKDRFALVMRAAQLLFPSNAAQSLDPISLGDWAQTWTRAYGSAFRFGNDEPKSLLRGKLKEQGTRFQDNLGKLTTWMQNQA